MKLFKGLMLASLTLAVMLPAMAAPPTNPGSQRNNRATEKVQERLGQTRSTERGRSQGRSSERGRPENTGRPEKTGRPENAGRPDKETKGSVRSALVNKGQNKLARINAEKILAKRLAQSEHLRDVALNEGNEELLAKADELEQLAREDYTRRTGLSSEPMEPATEPTPTEPAPIEPEPIDPVE